MKFISTESQVILISLLGMLAASELRGNDWVKNVEHKYADSNGLKIHYVKAGEGPLVVFIHGFPDFWYSWHHQMQTLSNDFTVVAMDTRGYNLSDQPEGVEQYDMSLLVADVLAVIASEGKDRATVVGHDWGGAIAWSLASMKPEAVENLIIVNLPHLACLARELSREDSQQHRNSQYARMFQLENSHLALNPKMLTGIVNPADDYSKQLYMEAFQKSSLVGMMNYYRRNYPRQPYQIPDLPKIQAPVLQFHGLDDSALLAPAVNSSWEHMAKDWTLVTLPGVGHWAHHQAANQVSQTMLWWLKMRSL